MGYGQILDSLDIFTFWLLNVSASFMLSAAHNVLFFVLDWRTPLLHFLHFASTLLFLLAKTLISPDRCFLPRLFGAFLRPLFAVSFGAPWLPNWWFPSSLPRSMHRIGPALSTWIFDFLGTIFVLRFGPHLLGKKEEDANQRRAIYILLVPLAVSASLSWLEFSHIEYDPWTIFLAPFLALAQAVHLLQLKRAQNAFFAAFQPAEMCHCQCQCHGPGGPAAAAAADPDLLFHRFSLCYLLPLTSILAFPALFSYAQSQVPYDASWESIDVALIAMSGIFMVGYKYSELWLQTQLEPHHFCALEHTKFFMASIGQWFLQNMAHATVFAALGKALFIASGLRYWTRLGEMRAKEKCGPKSSLANNRREAENSGGEKEENGGGGGAKTIGSNWLD